MEPEDPTGPATLQPYYCNVGTNKGQARIDKRINRAWVIASLEIVLRKGDSRFLVLRLNAYPNPNLTNIRPAEGYWALPNVQFELEDFDTDSPLSVANLRKRFQDQLREDSKLYLDSVKRLAESFGLRDVKVERYDEPIYEVKPSNNDPNQIRGFYTLRYRLTRAETETLINIADYEGRHGFVFLELGADEESANELLSDENIMDDPNNTGMPCVRFLGKPVISTVTRAIEDAEILASLLTEHSFEIAHDSFSHEHEGLICAADVAGYGTALTQKLRGLITDPESERAKFRTSILDNLESHLKSLGTLEIQTAGDGFIAAFPKWKYSELIDALHFVLNRWSECILGIQRQMNSVKGDDGQQVQIGSRMAICGGPYWFGRINGITSFFSSFDGENIIKAARMEQGLNRLITTSQSTAARHKLGPTVVPDASAAADAGQNDTAGNELPSDLLKHNHYTLVAGSAVKFKPFPTEFRYASGIWKLLTLCDVEAKEFNTRLLREETKRRNDEQDEEKDLEYYALYQWQPIPPSRRT